MTIHLPADLESSIRAEVATGHFASVDDAIAEAWRSFLHQRREGSTSSLTAEQQAEQELQHRLLKAGLLSEIKPPITDLTAYRSRRAVPIQGEPLSGTVIRERR